MRRFVITGGRYTPGVGAEFEVGDDATEEEIAVAAFEAIIEFLSYGWEEVEDDNEE